jgi:hypothetical protein
MQASESGLGINHTVMREVTRSWEVAPAPMDRIFPAETKQIGLFSLLLRYVSGMPLFSRLNYATFGNCIITALLNFLLQKICNG